MSGTQTPAKAGLGDWLKGGKPAADPAGSTASTGTAATQKPQANGGSGGGSFFMPSSEIDREWDLGQWLVRVVKAEDYTASGSGNKSFKVTLMGLNGAMRNAKIDDYWPKEGKGLKKTFKACKAIDLVDADNNISIPNGAQQMVDRELWIEILRVNEKRRDDDGNEITVPANKIGFLSYWHKSEFPVAVEGDLFADGAAEAALPTGGSSQTAMFKTSEGTIEANVATGEVVGVETDAPAF